MTIDLNPHHLDTVRAILAEHVPDCEVMAFGSRAAWTAHDRSDLDLAVACGERAAGGAIARLREAFEDSGLPIRVDVLDWHAIADSFRETIAPGCVVIQQAGPPNGWRTVTFGDIAEIVGGSTPSTRDPANFDGDVPWLTPQDLSSPHDRYISRGARNLSQQGFTSCSAKLVPPGTVLLSTRAPIGYVAIAKNPIATNQRFRSLILHDGVSTEYVYYWLLLNREELDRHASGSTFRELSGSALRKISLRLPPLDEQRRIARVLGALDERIEANRRATATLEEMARTLFRHWFVDFGPVRAKAAGLPSGLPPGLDALFPASLEASALGEAPAGWGWASVGDAVSVRGGTTPSTKEPAYWGGEHYFATPKDMSTLGVPVLTDSSRRLTDEGVARIRSSLLPPGTLLLSSRAPIGYLAITDVPVAVNQGIIAMVCEGAVGAPYTLHWVESNMAAVEARAGGTTFAGISKSAFRALPFLVPPAPIHAAYDRFAAPLYERIAVLARESRTLATIRDTLLPRLVTGDVRVAEETGGW